MPENEREGSKERRDGDRRRKKSISGIYWNECIRTLLAVRDLLPSRS